MENSVAFERATTLDRTTLATRESRERTVVILGGSYAAIQIAHRLLKFARMYVKNLKVVMVSKVRVMECSSSPPSPPLFFLLSPASPLTRSQSAFTLSHMCRKAIRTA